MRANIQSDFGPSLITALLAEIGDGVGCRHRFEPEFGISADLLVGTGLIKPINQRIPTCAEHGCPLVGRCAFERDFGPDSKVTRGNRKFRLTEAGKLASDDPDEMLVALTGSPAARAILAGLQAGTGSVFALSAGLLEAELRCARDEAAAPGYGRKELGDSLKLLQRLGVLTVEPDGTVRRLDAVP